LIIGVDYHPSFQQISFLDQETGECGDRELNHSDGEAERFYKELKQRGVSVRVGLEATGYSRWFERLLAELVMESTIETKASTILEFLKGLHGSLHVTLEEGTWAAWLYDLIKPHVTELVVCNPRRNALLKEGSKSDRIDARKLAELLRANLVRSVYHGEQGVRTLKELARSYLTISTDLIRVMSRLKAIYRSWGIPCTGKQVYAERHRLQWLGKIAEVGVRRRAEFYYQQLDALRSLRQDVRRELLVEAQKHDAWKLLRAIPFIGPIRAALIIAACKHRTGSVPSDSCGRISGSESRPIAVPSIAASMESCGARRSRSRFVG
jgi:transposase